MFFGGAHLCAIGDGVAALPFRLATGIGEFPHEELGIRKYFAAIQAQQATAGLFFASKVLDSLLPTAVGPLLVPLLSAAYGGFGLIFWTGSPLLAKEGWPHVVGWRYTFGLLARPCAFLSPSAGTTVPAVTIESCPGGGIYIYI